MSDPQQLHVDQGARFVLPYGCVVAVSGSGLLLHVSDRLGRSTIKLRPQIQRIGPFLYDVHAEIQATGEVTYEVFDLRAISQADLDAMTTLPVGTEAVVVVDATTRASKYWNGTEWASGGSDVGPPGEDAGRTLGETDTTASNITLTGETESLVTIDNDSANTVTLRTVGVDDTLEVGRPYLIRAIGDGATTFVASGSATIVMEAGKAAEIAAAHAPVTAMLVDLSTWWLFGALADA